MIKKLLILLFLPFLTTSAIAETVAYKLKGELIAFSYQIVSHANVFSDSVYTGQ